MSCEESPSFPQIKDLFTVLDKITQLIYISLVKGISPMLLQHFLRQKYLTTIPVVLGFQTKYGLLKLKTCSLYYKNLLLKFGRSEKGTKFEKIFHFQFDVTQQRQILSGRFLPFMQMSPISLDSSQHILSPTLSETTLI